MERDGSLTLRVEEGAHPGCVEEWVVLVWTPTAGLVTGQRIHGDRLWYWGLLAVHGAPLVTVSDFAVPRRSDPLLVKGPALWAEMICEDPARQWTVGNEVVAVALEDPADALGRAYGEPTPLAWDLEFYATGAPGALPPGEHAGYVQDGVVDAVVELAGRPGLRWAEARALRWHRWASAPDLPAWPWESARAHLGLRAPVAFPSGEVWDLVLTPDGWRARAL